MNFIDAHVHVWTPDTERYPLAAGFRIENMDPPSFTTEELSEQAVPVGVDRVVLIQMSFYGVDNSYMLDAIAKQPARYRGVAVIDSDRPNVATTMRDLKKKGVRGFRIYPKDQAIDRWLSTDGMRAMWKCGSEENLAMCCLMGPDGLPALDKMCDEFPNTPVVIDHMCLIGASGRLNPQEIQALCNMARHKQLSVKVSAFYALGHKKSPYQDLVPLIRRLCHEFGTDHLMWASDSPFQVVNGHTYKASIDLIQSSLDFLKPNDLEFLLRKTAERVFFR
ncbi:amidohydrolase family protein [Schlesneria paludicola]|uniref:amidohydrolase family protein n=1 Tax=Schlesneria paludicola TaxID=360056 RepID=UPI00029A0B9C|nr:amidohydrolase family protein [Schlesneria paludicola]